MEHEKRIEMLRSRKALANDQVLDQAADAIENLRLAVQAHSDLGNRMSNLNFGLVEMVLQADAAVSAAEEKMRLMRERFKLAVTKLDPCEICVGHIPCESCDSCDCDCLRCERKDCRCKECRDMDKWELRWPEVKA